MIVTMANISSSTPEYRFQCEPQHFFFFFVQTPTHAESNMTVRLCGDKKLQQTFLSSRHAPHLVEWKRGGRCQWTVSPSISIQVNRTACDGGGAALCFCLLIWMNLLHCYYCGMHSFIQTQKSWDKANIIGITAWAQSSWAVWHTDVKTSASALKCSCAGHWRGQQQQRRTAAAEESSSRGFCWMSPQAELSRAELSCVFSCLTVYVGHFSLTCLVMETTAQSTASAAAWTRLLERARTHTHTQPAGRSVWRNSSGWSGRTNMFLW